MMTESLKAKRDSKYDYNFIAPYDLDTCCNLLQGMNIASKDYQLYVSLSRMPSNAIHFTIDEYSVDRNPRADYPLYYADGFGELRHYTDSATYVSFTTRSNLSSQVLFGALFVMLIISLSIIMADDITGWNNVVFLCLLWTGAIAVPMPALLPYKRGLANQIKIVLKLTAAQGSDAKYVYFEKGDDS